MLFANFVACAFLFLVGIGGIFYGSDKPALYVTFTLGGAFGMCEVLASRHISVMAEEIRYPEQEKLEPIDWRLAWGIVSLLGITVVVGALACVGFIPHTQPLGPYLIY